MSDARSEQIMAAIETLLTGLTTTGTKVQRGQVYPHQAADIPALGILMGADTVSAEYQTGLVDWELNVFVESVHQVEASYTTMGSGIETKLNLIRKEVHAALLADHTLGLSFVIDIEPGNAGQPLLSDSGNIPFGSQMLSFIVHYRTSRTDISA